MWLKRPEFQVPDGDTAHSPEFQLPASAAVLLSNLRREVLSAGN